MNTIPSALLLASAGWDPASWPLSALITLAAAAGAAGASLLFLLLRPLPARRRAKAVRGRDREAGTGSEKLAACKARLEAAEAAYEGLGERLDEIQARSHTRLKLLETIADAALPALERLEQDARRLLSAEWAGQRIDRRTGLGPLAEDIRSVSVGLHDLLVLGRVEGYEGPPRDQLCEIRHLLEDLAAEHPALALCLAPEVPALIRTDRALLAVAFSKAAELTDSAAGAVPVRVTADPVRADLMEVKICFEEIRDLPREAASWLEQVRDEPGRFVELGRQGLLLVASARAMARLGGNLEIAPREDAGTDLWLKVIVPVAVDRRRALRVMRSERGAPVA